MKKEYRKLHKSLELELPPCVRLTAFTAVKRPYGFHIQVAGCLPLRPAVNLPPYVVGIIELSDQLVPIIDMKARSGQGNTVLDEQCCIVLFEHKIGLTAIVTGRLYASACEVFELIVEYMDEKEHPEELLNISEDTILMNEKAC